MPATLISVGTLSNTSSTEMEPTFQHHSRVGCLKDRSVGSFHVLAYFLVPLELEAKVILPSVCMGRFV